MNIEVAEIFSDCYNIFAEEIFLESEAEQVTVRQSVVKKASIVANKKARINWTKSEGADGYHKGLSKTVSINAWRNLKKGVQYLNKKPFWAKIFNEVGGAYGN